MRGGNEKNSIKECISSVVNKCISCYILILVSQKILTSRVKNFFKIPTSVNDNAKNRQMRQSRKISVK